MNTPLTRTHPKTGQPLELLGWTKRGLPIWPVMGASPEDESNDELDPNSASGEGGEAGKTGEGEDGGDTDTAKSTVSPEDFERLRRQLSAADKRIAEYDKRQKAEEDAKKSELTKASERVTELEGTVTKLQEENNQLKLTNEFSMLEGYTWKNPATALRIARAEGFLDEVIGDDGAVDKGKLKKQIEAFSKKWPELTKGEKQEDGVKPPSGTAVGSGRQTTPTGADEDKLRRRYSALRR